MRKFFAFLFISVLSFCVFAIDITHTVNVTSWDHPGCSFPTFCTLPAGTYQFQVTAGDQDCWVCIATNGVDPSYGWDDITYAIGTTITRTFTVDTIIYGFCSGLLPQSCTLHVWGGPVRPPVWTGKPYTYNIHLTPGVIQTWSQDLSLLCQYADTYAGQGLPSWLTLASSIISGTVPAVNTSYTFTINATNSDGVSGASFTINVDGAATDAPNILQPLVFDAYKNSEFSADLMEYFSGSTSFTLGTGKPAWLSQVGTVMSGFCPSTETMQNYIFDITATNTHGSATSSCTINIKDIIDNDKLKITSPSSVMSAKSFSYIPTTNKTNATITVTALMPGLTYSGGFVSGMIPDGIESFTFQVNASAPEQTPVSMTVYVEVGTDPNNPANSISKHVIVDNFGDNKANFADTENALRQANAYLAAIGMNTNATALGVNTMNLKWDKTQEKVVSIDSTLTAIHGDSVAINTSTQNINNNLVNFMAKTDDNFKSVTDRQDITNGHLSDIKAKQDLTNQNLNDIKDKITNLDELKNLTDIKNGVDKLNTGVDKANEHLSHLSDNSDDLNNMLKEPLDSVDLPGDDRQIYDITVSDMSFKSQFVTLFGPHSSAPPSISLPLSAVNVDGWVSLSDIPVDFNRPEITNVLALIRAMELGCFFIGFCIIAIRIIRSFEF